MDISISDLAREFDVTTRSIRFYEEKGLISPRREGQRRIFSNADRTKLRLILRGKRLGFSLDESLQIIQMYRPEKSNVDQLNALIDKIDEQREKLKRKQDDLKLMLAELSRVETVCRSAIEEHGAKQ